MGDEMDVGMKCIKYMLFVANFMFVMIGFLLISIGSTIKAIYTDFEEFMESYYFAPSNLAIAVGIIIFFVALFGCVGAIRESTALINLFAVFLGILLILELVTCGIAYTMRGKINHRLHDAMKDSIMTNEKDIWDFTQKRLGCCGVDNYTDWLDHGKTFGDMDNFTGPLSCCRRYPHVETCIIADVHKEGCYDSVHYILTESSLLLGCGALAVAFIQILGIVFAVLLAKSVRQIKTKKLVEGEINRQNIYEQMAREKNVGPTPVLYTPTFSEC